MGCVKLALVESKVAKICYVPYIWTKIVDSQDLSITQSYFDSLFNYVYTTTSCKTTCWNLLASNATSISMLVSVVSQVRRSSSAPLLCFTRFRERLEPLVRTELLALW